MIVLLYENDECRTDVYDYDLISISKLYVLDELIYCIYFILYLSCVYSTIVFI